MTKKIILIVIIVVALTYCGFRFKIWLDIDKCLDRGGRWDYEEKECVYK